MQVHRRSEGDLGEGAHRCDDRVKVGAPGQIAGERMQEDPRSHPAQRKRKGRGVVARGNRVEGGSLRVPVESLVQRGIELGPQRWVRGERARHPGAEREGAIEVNYGRRQCA